MDSLQLHALPLLHPRPSSPSITQLRFPPPLIPNSRNLNFRSFSAHTGGAAASQDGPFAFEEKIVTAPKDDRGLVLAKETDDFGYLVGFRLLPETGLIPFFLSLLFHSHIKKDFFFTHIFISCTGKSLWACSNSIKLVKLPCFLMGLGIWCISVMLR